MKSLVLLLFVIGVIMLTTGYQKQLLKSYEIEKQVEYRFIPRSIYEEQLGQPTVTKSFAEMFERKPVFMTSPYT